MDTKSRILEAAKTLFARHGLEKASMRLICSEAGVNIASINYHFGSKENLIKEIFVRLVIPIDLECNRLLEQAKMQSGGAPVPIKDLVRAFLSPWFEFKKQHPEFIVAFGQFYSGQDKPNNQYFRDLVLAKAKEVHIFFIEAVCEAIPKTPRQDILMRVNLAVTTGVSVLMNNWLTDSLENLSGMPITDDILLEYMASFIEFGLPKIKEKI